MSIAMSRRTIFILLFGCCGFWGVKAQGLTLDSCLAMANRHYPLAKQFALIEKSRAYSIENAQKAYLPQINISGQATYQSDVTQVPISLPGLELPQLSKDQYRLYGEINQPITDLATVKYRKEVIQGNTLVEHQKAEVELYQLRERINQLFFGILLIDAQMAQTELFRKDIQAAIDKTRVAIDNGISLQSSVDILEVEQLKSDQRMTELAANRKAFTDMLSLFVNREITESTALVPPALPGINKTLSRPELRLFELQQQALAAQDRLLGTRTRPKLSAFVQAGLGRPALNVLSNELEGYYIGGLRLNWNISSFYTIQNERQLLSISQKTIGLQRDIFVFNANLAIQQRSAEVAKIQKLVDSDNDIIRLRERITASTKSQLENGTATSIDFVTQLNAEDQAKQNKILHQIQLLLAAYNLQTSAGN